MQLTKNKIYTILIILLLLTDFFWALSRFELPNTHTSSWGWGEGDKTRDYLIAHYIVQDGQKPLLGPFNAALGNFVNSPLYFYLLAGFLKIYDSVFFLGIVNILFHVATIFLIYLIAKSLFGSFKALLSAFLFALVPEVFRQTGFVFQPHQMQPFAYLALFLLIQAHKKKNFKIALLSLTVLCFAGAIHTAAFAWLPLFLVIIFLLVKRNRLQRLIYMLLSLIIAISIFYFPVFVYYSKNPQFLQSLSINTIFPIFSPLSRDFVSNLYHFFLSIIKVFSLNLGSKFQIDRLIAIILIAVSLIYYFFTQNKKAKTTIAFGFCFLIIPIFLVSLFPRYGEPLYRLILTFGIFVMIATEVVISSISHIFRYWSYKLRLISVLIIILLFIKVFSHNFAFLKPKIHPQSLLALNGAVAFMEQEISRIKHEEGFFQPNFFRIIAINHSLISNNPDFYYYPPLDSVFLVPLEKNLQTKLAKTALGSVEQTGTDNFIFLICVEYYKKHLVENCEGSFYQYYPDHMITKNIYIKHPLSVYLAERNTL